MHVMQLLETERATDNVCDALVTQSRTAVTHSHIVVTNNVCDALVTHSFILATHSHIVVTHNVCDALVTHSHTHAY